MQWWNTICGKALLYGRATFFGQLVAWRNCACSCLFPLAMGHGLFWSLVFSISYLLDCVFCFAWDSMGYVDDLWSVVQDAFNWFFPFGPCSLFRSNFRLWYSLYLVVVAKLVSTSSGSLFRCVVVFCHRQDDNPTVKTFFVRDGGRSYPLSSPGHGRNFLLFKNKYSPATWQSSFGGGIHTRYISPPPLPSPDKWGDTPPIHQFIIYRFPKITVHEIIMQSFQVRCSITCLSLDSIWSY